MTSKCSRRTSAVRPGVTGVALLVLASVLFTPLAGAAATILVTPGNMNGWVFNVTDNGGVPGGTGTGQLVNGPATPPAGTGSANFNLTSNNGDESVQLRNGDWAGTRLDELTVLSYSTYATSLNDPVSGQLPFLNLYLDTDNDNTQDSRLWFEPVYSGAGAGNGNPNPQPNIALNSWQTWDLLTGMWYTDDGLPGGNGPGSNAITFQTFLAAFPDATLVNVGPGGIRIASGFASASDSFNTFVDAFTIGTASGSTTYDFELEENVPVPEPSTLTLLGLGLAGLARRVRRRFE